MEASREVSRTPPRLPPCSDVSVFQKMRMSHFWHTHHMLVFSNVAAMGVAKFARTTTWYTSPPSQCTRIAHVECVREASTSVMHASGHAPGILTTCLWPSVAESAFWCPPKKPLRRTTVGGEMGEHTNPPPATASNANP